MSDFESADQGILLEYKINDELLRLCRKHGINRGRQGRLLFWSIALGLTPFLMMVVAFEFRWYLWACAVTFLFATAIVASAGEWFLGRREKQIDADIRRACREATEQGYFIVRSTHEYLYHWYPYLYILRASKSFIPEEDPEHASGRLAHVERYPDPWGIELLLCGQNPPIKSDHKTI